MSEQNAYTIISKDTALAQGLKRYFTGIPCKNGHVTERLVKTGHCIGCKKAWRDSNVDKISVSSKTYYEENKETLKQKTRKYATSDRVRTAAYSKAYRDKYPERIKDTVRKYKSANPHIVNANTAKRRASKKKATPAWADSYAIRMVYKVCSLLSTETGLDHHVDHIIPLAHPLVCGLHVEDNLQVVSALENLKKSNKFTIE